MSQMFHVPDQLSFNKLSGKGVTKLGQKLGSYVTMYCMYKKFQKYRSSE